MRHKMPHPPLPQQLAACHRWPLHHRHHCRWENRSSAPDVAPPASEPSAQSVMMIASAEHCQRRYQQCPSHDLVSSRPLVWRTQQNLSLADQCAGLIRESSVGIARDSFESARAPARRPSALGRSRAIQRSFADRIGGASAESSELKSFSGPHAFPFRHAVQRRHQHLAPTPAVVSASPSSSPKA